MSELSFIAILIMLIVGLGALAIPAAVLIPPVSCLLARVPRGATLSVLLRSLSLVGLYSAFDRASAAIAEKLLDDGVAVSEADALRLQLSSNALDRVGDIFVAVRSEFFRLLLTVPALWVMLRTAGLRDLSLVERPELFTQAPLLWLALQGIGLAALGGFGVRAGNAARNLLSSFAVLASPLGAIYIRAVVWVFILMWQVFAGLILIPYYAALLVLSGFKHLRLLLSFNKIND
jgi:hypothetical protein